MWPSSEAVDLIAKAKRPIFYIGGGGLHQFRSAVPAKLVTELVHR